MNKRRRRRMRSDNIKKRKKLRKNLEKLSAPLRPLIYNHPETKSLLENLCDREK